MAALVYSCKVFYSSTYDFCFGETSWLIFGKGDGQNKTGWRQGLAVGLSSIPGLLSERNMSSGRRRSCIGKLLGGQGLVVAGVSE